MTLFEITDPTADSGPIVGQIEVPIARDETATTLYDKLAEAHVRLVRDALPLIAAGSEPRSLRTRSARARGSSGRQLDGIIDWETRAPYLYDWVRAQTRPYPGAFTLARRREGGGLERCPPRGRERAPGWDDRRAAPRWDRRGVW